MEMAEKYFLKNKNDSRSLNSLGYIYFKAPDVFEQDPVLKNTYGSIRRDILKAKRYFENAGEKGNVNALYNLGCFYLT
jgi:TPR repeat protein